MEGRNVNEIKRKIVKKSLKYVIAFLSLFAVMCGGLVATAFIPKDLIRENVKGSAEYLCEGELFAAVIEGASGSKIDRYADSILLAIAYQYDNEQPLRSVMRSAYYYDKYQNENENLLEAVTHDYEANLQYLRYWHGSIAVVRPLLLFFDIKQIYIVNGVLLTGFTLWLLVVLWKQKAYIPAVGMLAGLILTAVWFVPLSLEYTWTYLLMLLFSVFAIRLLQADKKNLLGYCFMASGMVTNFMDFLTTETLTFTVPLLIILWIEQKKSIFSVDAVKLAGTSAVTWGCGYVGMWGMKWLSAALVLRENVMPYVVGHVAERLGVNSRGGIAGYVQVLWRNIRCLFPIEYGEIGWLVAIAIILTVCYVGYVYHKDKICKPRVMLYAAIGMLPYLRYLVLFDHSYQHYFFTYRAQLVTILSVAMILGEVVEWRYFIHANTRKRKH